MLIGLTGRIAAGKGVIKDFLEKKGFKYSTFSDVVREEAGKLGIKITRKNLQDLGNDYRIKFGAEVWAKKIIEKSEPNKNYVVDGIRNPGEILELRKLKDFVLIAVDAPQKIRFQRMIERNKPSDPKTWEEFLEIDERDFGKNEPEYGQQVGKCMELADFKIINDADLEKSVKEIRKIWEKIKKRINDKNNNYKGVIIEESLEDNSVLKDIKIIKTEVEKATPEHKTSWISKWTLHSVEIPEKEAKKIADKISKVLDSKHNWYADFKNKKFHFIIFKNKVFCVDIYSKKQYNQARKYGISLGIPEYQVDFHPEVKAWER